MDISSLGKGEPERLTPLSWEITGADITCLVASCFGEKEPKQGEAMARV